MKWYNEETKQQFIAFLEKEGVSDSYIATAKTIFNRVAPYERNEWKMDIYDLYPALLADVFAKCGWTDAKTFEIYKTVLTRYITWAIDNRLCSPRNAAMDIGFKDVITPRMTSSSFKDEKMFIEALKEVFAIDDLSTDDNGLMTRAALILSWLGYNTDEIIDLKKTDLNGNVLDNGKWKVELSEEFERVLKAAIASEGFATEYIRKPFIKYVNNDRIIRSSNIRGNSGVVKKGTLNSWLFDRLKKAQRVVSPQSAHKLRDMTYSKLIRNGRFVYLLRWEQAHGTPTPNNYEEWKLAIPNAPELRERCYTFLKGYEGWKYSFGL